MSALTEVAVAVAVVVILAGAAVPIVSGAVAGFRLSAGTAAVFEAATRARTFARVAARPVTLQLVADGWIIRDETGRILDAGLVEGVSLYSAIVAFNPVGAVAAPVTLTVVNEVGTRQLTVSIPGVIRVN